MNKILPFAIALATGFAGQQALAETKVSTKGGLKVTNGEHTVQFGGRIQYDYNNSQLNGDTVDSQFDLRRGRVFVKGNVAPNWHFKVNYNVDGSGTEDMYVRYTGWGKAAVVTVGKQNPGFTLEQLESSKDISIIERSAITERYLIGRRDSVQLHGNVSNFHYAVSAFTEEEADGSKEEELGFTARTTYAPIKADRSIVHLGASYKDIDTQSAYGIELGAVAGSFFFQGEYLAQEEDEKDDIDGFYLQAAYVITGESRPYKNGLFKRIKPNSPKGAWEVAARYESGDGKYSDIELGKIDATAYTLGVNYYANNNMKISASYSQGEDANTDNDGKDFRMSFLLAF